MDFKDNFQEIFRKTSYFYNKHLVDSHNQKYEKGLVSFKLRANELSTMVRVFFSHDSSLSTRTNLELKFV